MAEAAKSQLILHCGARQVDREELDLIDAPPPTRSWVPVRHSIVLDSVCASMREAGFTIRKVQMGVARDNHRLFATVDTESQLNCGSVTLAVAVVNSTDKSLPMKFIAGNRCLCCDNLAMRSDLMAPVRRKHSRFGLDRFREALKLAVADLDTFQEVEKNRIARFQAAEVSDVQAESLLLRCFERGIVSHRTLPKAIQEWRTPSFEEFRPRTLWSLENALTTTLGPLQKSNPQRFVSTSLSLQSLLTGTFTPSEN